LAGQAFPPDFLRYPLIEYALPNWLQGNIARNVGTVLGFGGVWALTPLLVFVAVGCWFLFNLDRNNQQLSKTQAASNDPALASVVRPSIR
jgi:hypothetical protein